MYNKKPIGIGDIHAMGRKGIVFVWNRVENTLSVRTSGSMCNIDVIHLRHNSDVEGVMKKWLAGNSEFCFEQDKLAKVRQEAEDRAAALQEATS